jgi:hypothetical protein
MQWCRAVSVAAVLAALTGSGCRNDLGSIGENPNYREPMINGYIYKTEDYDGSIEYDKDVEVFDNDGLPMVPVVTLNGQPVEIYYYSWTMYLYGDPYYNPVEQKYELNVKHYWGDAFSRVVLPGDFRVTNPPAEYILGMESTLVITWQASASAQWYWLSMYADYDYLDTLYEWDNFTFYLDTLVYDTFIAVSPGRVFPSFVKVLQEGDGSASVWAGNGPAVEPGDVDNVRGAGFGFFNAINEPRQADFYVGAPPKARRSPGAGEGRDKLLSLLRQRASGRKP